MIEGCRMPWYARREDWKAQVGDARRETDVDYARIIHSASFRRLQGKTQILNLGDGDFYRTRLTHSLEVAQIAGGIARQFGMLTDHAALPHLPDLSMIQAAGATHDLGHPPFGHGGEVALNYCMRDHGGFEGNGQTLRIVARLEKFSSAAGANLTRRTMLSLLKYPSSYSTLANPTIVPALNSTASSIRIIDRNSCKPPKCYLDEESDVVTWLLDPVSEADREAFTSTIEIVGSHAKTRHKSFDCSIMDVADDIAFGVHDLEDALALGLIEEDAFRRHVPEDCAASFLDHLKERYPKETGNDVYDGFVSALFGEGGRRKRFIGRMVHHLIADCRINEVDELKEPLLRYRAKISDGPARFLTALKAAVRETVILSPSVQQLEFKGQTMVIAVFEALSSEPRSFLPRDTFARWERSASPKRVICDHIAGMTDLFLMRTYERLFAPRMGSVFDRL